MNVSTVEKLPLHLRASVELELRRRYDKEYGPARKKLQPFIQATKANIVMGWFLMRLCQELDKFLEDVFAGKNPRLMIIAPPRHGKTESASRRFPAFALGKYPTSNIIAASYAADLAARNNRDVQRVIDTLIYSRIFPGTKLNAKNIATLSGTPLRNSTIFEVVEHLGSYRGAGVGQGITGMGFNIGLIDDPVKDAQQANSEVERNGIWEWYEQVFYTRADQLSGIVLIMTRWHEDDLAGRLLHRAQFEGGDKWNVVRFPAIAEEDEKHRKEGEALHPERFPLKRLEQIRGVIGEYAFSALYQGRPMPKGGGIVKREDFRFYRRAEIRDVPKGRDSFFDFIAISVDAAFKDTINASYVVIQVWGRAGAKSYLLAQRRKRMTFTQTLTELRSVRKDFPTANATLIEDKANGTAIVDVLGKEFPGVIAIEPIGSKTARAEAAAPLIQAGNVILPHPEEEPWVELFIAEWLSVPTGAFWDQVDAADQYLLKYGRTYNADLDPNSVVLGQSLIEESGGKPWE